MYKGFPNSSKTPWSLHSPVKLIENEIVLEKYFNLRDLPWNFKWLSLNFWFCVFWTESLNGYCQIRGKDAKIWFFFYLLTVENKYSGLNFEQVFWSTHDQIVVPLCLISIASHFCTNWRFKEQRKVLENSLKVLEKGLPWSVGTMTYDSW